MIIQVICLALGAALACLWSAIGAVRGASASPRGWSAPLNDWESLVVFATANTAALAAGVEPTQDWSLAAPLWVASALLHGLFSLAGLAPARLAALLAALAVSGWIFAMAIQAASVTF
ncbi:MAG: hypothetical protein OXP09_10730 [Gammaproteobacteria bacterium]|nr:hypothetical protein [Gammaproteobacteria bacterium]